MGEVEQFRFWMDQNGIQLKSLAEKMKMSYLSVYIILVKRKSITNNFRWRFAQVFGWETARELFEQPAETERETVEV